MPEFEREQRKSKAEMVRRAGAMLTAAADRAVKTLLELMKESKHPPTRLEAARMILELGVSLRDSAE